MTLHPPPPDHRGNANPPGRGWLIWVVVAMIAGGGLALLPEDTVRAPPATTAHVLPAPEMATTSTILAATTPAVMSEDTFLLIPTDGLHGFVQLAGPVEFAGMHWIAGNQGYPSPDVTILSSIDGARWVTAAVLSAEDGEWLRIDDMGTFGGVLMAIGTVGEQQQPAFAPNDQGSLILWKSSDGRRWSSLPILAAEGLGSGGPGLTVGAEEVLITGYRGPAFDTSVLEEIPPELVPGLERGDFTWWYDYLSIVVVAPPGIELFRMPAPPSTRSSGSKFLLRSENLIIWEQLPATFSAWNVATTSDGGFVLNDTAVMYSDDGRSWEQTDRFPPLYYQNWGDRLLGLDYSRTPSRLFVFEGEEAATIVLPAEIADTQYGLSITPGDPGLAGIRWTYEPTYAEPITQVDGYILAIADGALRIEEPSGETSFANFDSNGLIGGTYIPGTDSIRFGTNQAGKTFEFPVAALVDLRATPPRGRFDVFVSPDGLVWARPQTGLRAGYVEILGSTDQSFLVALHNYGPDYRELPMTVYRTGPIG